MNKNRILELLTDKEVIILYEGNIVNGFTDEHYLVSFSEQGVWNDSWEIVDFAAFTFYRKFDATI